jgi:hypothetical protein
MELAKQGAALARQAGSKRNVLKWDNTIVELMQRQQEIYRRNSTAIEKSTPKVKALYNAMKDGEKELEALMRQRNALFESGALDARSEERRRKAQSELSNLDTQIRKIMEDASRGDEFLKSIGLEQNLGKITAGLTEALNRSRKDWSLEVQAAKEAFAREVIPIRVAVDPTGAKGVAAQALGIEPREGETAPTLARRVDEASVKLLREAASLEQQIANRRKEAQGLLVGSNELLAAGAADTVNKLRSIKVDAEVYAIATNLIASHDERRAAANQALSEMAEKQLGTAIELGTRFTEVVRALQQGKEVTAAMADDLGHQVFMAEAQGQITREQFSAYSKLFDVIEATRNKQAEINLLQKQLPAKEQINAAQQNLNIMNSQSAAQRQGADASKEMKDRIFQAKQQLDLLLQGANNTTQAMQGTANAAEATQAQTAQLGPTAASQVSQVNALAAAYERMARAAAAAAQARGSAGAVAYHGGPMSRFFADGGFVGRGQDKIMAALSKGETVVNSKQSRRFFSELNAMNQGSQPVYREQGGPVTNVGDVNVTVNGGDSSAQTVREIGRGLRREIRRGNIKLT